MHFKVGRSERAVCCFPGISRASDGRKEVPNEEILGPSGFHVCVNEDSLRMRQTHDHEGLRVGHLRNISEVLGTGHGRNTFGTVEVYAAEFVCERVK